jgi:hypothetical protein
MGMVNRIRNAGLALGLNITRPTNSSEVLTLIKELRPMDCGKKLIRIGGMGDGGYLVPDDLEGIQYCFSPGVGFTASFEAHLSKLKIRSFLADYSVNGPPANTQDSVFDKKFLAAGDTDTSFSLKSWKEKYLPGYTGELLLQMDIEGSEYEVILSTAEEVLNSFRIIVAEFHYMDRLFDRFAYKTVFKPCFEKLLRHFYVAHIHPNNAGGLVEADGVQVPMLMEFTFHNKNRVSGVTERRDVPHALDCNNVPGEALPLPKVWYAD